MLEALYDVAAALATSALLAEISVGLYPAAASNPAEDLPYISVAVLNCSGVFKSLAAC